MHLEAMNNTSIEVLHKWSEIWFKMLNADILGSVQYIIGQEVIHSKTD
jgi:hypothetical protein